MGRNGYRTPKLYQYSLIEDLLHHRQTDPQWQAEQRLPRGVGDFGVADTDPLGQAEVIHFRLGDEARPGLRLPRAVPPLCSAAQPYHATGRS